MYTKIAHITDLHLDEAFPKKHNVQARKRFEKVLDDIRNERIQEVICTGDIGEGEGIAYFFEQLAGFDLKVTLGNHDALNTTVPYFGSNTVCPGQKLYYSIQRDAHQCIYLDSSPGLIDAVQLNWLGKALDTTHPILIFMHHPVLGLDLKVDEIGKLQNRVELKALLTRVAQQVTIFCGHYHLESSLQHQNIRQYITPAVSYQIEKHKDCIEIDAYRFGYRIIRIEQGQVSSKIRELSNAN